MFSSKNIGNLDNTTDFYLDLLKPDVSQLKVRSVWPVRPKAQSINVELVESTAMIDEADEKLSSKQVIER